MSLWKWLLHGGVHIAPHHPGSIPHVALGTLPVVSLEPRAAGVWGGLFAAALLAGFLRISR